MIYIYIYQSLYYTLTCICIRSTFFSVRNESQCDQSQCDQCDQSQCDQSQCDLPLDDIKYTHFHLNPCPI